MNRVAVAALLFVGITGCFSGVDLPACKTLGDCPVHYNSCVQGYCFLNTPVCEAKDGDGCCGVSGDRGHDSDCLLVQADLRGNAQVSMDFGDIVADSDLVYAEATTGSKLVLLGVDGQGRVTKRDGPASQSKPMTPAASKGFCLFPVGDAFVLWGPGMREIKTDTWGMTMAAAYASSQGVFFYGAAPGGKVYVVDATGKVYTVSGAGVSDTNFSVLTQETTGVLTVCDGSKCVFYDLTSGPAIPKLMFSVTLGDAPTGRIRVSGNSLWVPVSNGVDVYKLDSDAATRISRFSFENPVIAWAHGSTAGVLSDGRAFLIDATGTKHELAGVNNVFAGDFACDGAVVMGDSVALYLSHGKDRQWYQSLTGIDPALIPAPGSGMVVWGNRAAYLSTAGVIVGIPLTCP